MIPKIIHYVWMGGKPLPEYAKKNIETWKKFNPDYEIREWNESNFDIDYCKYEREVYDSGKLGFIGDIVRIYALYHFGGIYLDVDVECLKPFDALLDNRAVMGFEGRFYLSNAILMSEKGNPLFKYFLKQYDGRSFKSDDKYLWGCGYDLISGPVTMTSAFMKFYKKHYIENGKYNFPDVTILPRDYLSPSIWDYPEDHHKCVTENTVTIHHFEGSWKVKEPLLLTKSQKRRIKLKFIIAFKFNKILGNRKCLKSEQAAYQLAQRYNKINRGKNRKNVTPW